MGVVVTDEVMFSGFISSAEEAMFSTVSVCWLAGLSAKQQISI